MRTLEHLNIFRFFSGMAAQYPDKAAVAYVGTLFSYATVLRRVERFATALAALGFKKGDRIVMYSPDSVQFVVVWLGIQR